MTRPRRRYGWSAALLVAASLAAPAAGPPGGQPAAAAPVPGGFQEQVAFSGLVQPTSLKFAPDGRLFVAEEAGLIKVFDGLADATATTFADLRPVVHDLWDRGLFGLALHPEFPAQPWVYVLYTYDAPPGQTAPFWGDDCSSVTGGPNGGRCVVTGRLSRLQAAGNQQTGGEQVLIHDWCQQFSSHSIGSLGFGADGALYVSGGDGASFNTVDYGQLPVGGPTNPCGDPPGGTMQPPTAEGGALRAQAVRSAVSGTASLDGSILRLDPETGDPLPDNPLAGSADPNRQRVVGHGLRNPYRMVVRPGTDELWIGDVGWNQWEEINVLPDPTAGPGNFGWPCYEGAGPMGSYANAGLDLCASLYAGPGQTAPYYTYRHTGSVVPGESCPNGTSSISGLAFYPETGGAYPADFNGALFFADYSRQCIWVMKPAVAGGPPSPAAVSVFVQSASGPVDLAVGPGGELYWPDIVGGTIRRVRYTAQNTPPTAVVDATPTSGPLPLTVTFDASGSFDPDPADAGNLRYQWDFTGDGAVDATTPTAQFTYQTGGPVTAELTVTDTLDAQDSETVTIAAGSEAPSAVIDTPAAGLTWAVGDGISFGGHATEPDGTPLPAAALTWQLRVHHCATLGNCHTHVVQDWAGVAGGTFQAPDHEYPSYLELVLTAEGTSGLTQQAARELHPKTVALTMATDPARDPLALGSASGAAPFTRTVIRGSAQTISALPSHTVAGVTYTFDRWGHGGNRAQVVTAPATPTTYTAIYQGPPAPVSYEAEAVGNSLGGSAVVRSLPGGSGGLRVGFVGNGVGNFVQFNGVVVAESGPVGLTVDYVSGVGRPATLSVNGGPAVELVFPATADWSTVGELSVVVDLVAGSNTLRFTHPGSYAPDFDRVVVGPVPPPAPVSYEAEAVGNSLGGSAVVRSLPGGSGGLRVGFVGNGVGNFVQFNGVVVAESGPVGLTVDYVSGVGRPATLSVNGGPAVELVFPATADWSTVGELSVVVDLVAGSNTLRFTHPGSYAPDFDRVVVGPVPPPAPVSYEAEAVGNSLGGSAVVRSLPGGSGGLRVGFVGNGVGNFVQFNGVVVAESGPVGLTVDYVSGVGRPATLSVNGGPAVELVFPATADWSTVGELSVVVDLVAGSNTLRFTHPGSYAPDFDRIVVG